MTGERYGLVSFMDYSDLRLSLMDWMLEREATKPSERRGLIGAAAVVLHAAIEEWVTGYLRADANELAIEEGTSYNRLIREMDLERRSLIWKIEKLALQSTSGKWRLAHSTDEVRALHRLNEERNRLVHMEFHELHVPIRPDDEDGPPPDPQSYEVGRMTYEVRITRRDDGSEESWGKHTVILQDPWRGLPLSVIRNAETAFREMRRQYETRTGDHVGVLKLPNGPIWRRSEP